MNIAYLHSFYTTVKYNSISKAAQDMHLTQPGLSKQLQNLENEMGIKLLHRSNKGVELTEEGKLVYEYAATMISLTDNLRRDLKYMQNKKSHLIICSCKSLGEHILPCSIYTFKEIYSNIDITMDICNSQNVLKKLLNHDINIGILMDVGIPKSVTAIPIMHDNLILVSGKDAKEENITIEELKNLSFILREQGSGILSLLKNALEEKFLDLNSLNIHLCLNSVESIKASILSGKGYAFLPQSVVSRELKIGTLKKINIQDFSISFDYYIAFRNNYFLSDYEKKFIEFLSSKKRCFCY